MSHDSHDKTTQKAYEEVYCSQEITPQTRYTTETQNGIVPVTGDHLKSGSGLIVTPITPKRTLKPRIVTISRRGRLTVSRPPVYRVSLGGCGL